VCPCFPGLDASPLALRFSLGLTSWWIPWQCLVASLSSVVFLVLLGCCFGLSSGVGLASFPWIPWSYEVPSRGSECPAVFGVLGCCRSCRACPSLLPWIASWTVVWCFLWCFLGCLGLGLLSGSGTKDRLSRGERCGLGGLVEGTVLWSGVFGLGCGVTSRSVDGTRNDGLLGLG
jgi:hypothetical protein